jgi:hypothetical protein
MTTDILAQQTADLAVTKQQLRAAIEAYADGVQRRYTGQIWSMAVRSENENRHERAWKHLDALIDALPIPDGASDGEGSEG